MKIQDATDTIIAPITSATGGSVSLVRISGPESIDLSNKFFAGKDLKESEGGQFYFGKFKDDDDQIIDEVVLSVFKSPNSFTGENVVEISFHANPFIIDSAIQLFLNCGCRMADPGEFSKRAFLNGKMDLVQAEAVAGLISSKSLAAVNNSITHLSGKFSNEIDTIRKVLIKAASLLELDLDFSEEDLEIITPEQIKKVVADSIKKIDSLIKSYNKGRILTEGISVFITGKPNVGKSSLMNALLGKDRVIVSSMPGTTRDIVHEEIYVDNILVRFIDSAGIHLTDNSIEAEGIERAQDYSNKADLIILVVDVSEKFTQDDKNLLKLISNIYKEKAVIACNKIDLPVKEELGTSLEKYEIPFFEVSAKTGTNIEQLTEFIPKSISGKNIEPNEEVFITNQRQHKILQDVKNSLDTAFSGLIDSLGNEFIAVDIREAIDHFSRITGDITTDDILKNIFSNFCIGK